MTRGAAMVSPDEALLERAAQLKGRLIDFAQTSPRVAKHLNNELAARMAGVDVADDELLINTVDRFVLQAVLPDGRTPLAHFCERRDLDDADRALLLGWQDVVEGIFEIDAPQDRDGAIETHNVIDELPYRIVANAGRGVLAPARRKGYIAARVVPLATGEWMLSGACSLLPRSARPHLLRVAAEQAMEHPELVWRNPDKLARAWELQHRDRSLFVEYFGADLVVLPGAQTRQRWDEYWQWRLRQPAAPETEAARGRKRVSQPASAFTLSEQLYAADSVGLIYDEAEGLMFLADFERVRATFADPGLARDPEHRRAVRGYLDDESVSAVPFRRLAAEDPQRASQVFARVLNKPKFRWERDGEALLRKHKPMWFDREARPQVVPVGESLARALRAA